MKFLLKNVKVKYKAKKFSKTLAKVKQGEKIVVIGAGTMGNGGEIYIFDMGKPVKIIDLAKKMIKLA